MIVLLIFSFKILTFLCTIDISLPEMEYLANHLEPEECWKLAITLHSSSFETGEELGQNEQPVLSDLNCLEQLLHWNSQVNEGLDETQAILAHRLRQIGRKDLSDWLTKTVYEELGKDLNKSLLSDPFKDLAEITSTTECLDFVGNFSDQIVTNQNIWRPYDTVFTVIIILLLITLIWLACKIINVSNKPKSTLKSIRLSKTRDDFPLLRSV